MGLEIIGYGGYAKIIKKQYDNGGLPNEVDGTVKSDGSEMYFFVTGGSLQLQTNRPTANTYFAPPTQTPVSKFYYGVGTAAMTGSLNFDLSKNNLSYIIASDFLCRNNRFDLQLSDGQGRVFLIDDCIWNSLSINANPNALVTCAISFNALNDREPSFFVNNRDDIPDGDFSNDKTPAKRYFENQLVAYWDCGGRGIESFSLNFSQDVTPVYLNNKYIMPTYFRVGNFAINASIVSYDDLNLYTPESKMTDVGEGELKTIDNEAALSITLRIGNRTITFLNTIVINKSFAHAGSQDIGKFTYNIEGMIRKRVDEDLFTIGSIKP